jgi:alanine dehydrogenase
MLLGTPKEIKDRENRVALTPTAAGMLVQAGHTVKVERNAGAGAGFPDGDYINAGAEIVDTASAWDADLVLKVKEPQQNEYPYLKNNILFTYLHLAGVAPALTEHLLKAKTTAIAYETVEDQHGRFPLLAPMSAIAGNMAAMMGTYYLARINGGKGVQPGRIQTSRHGKVMIIGDGVVGQHAALTADGIGAEVYLFGKSRIRLQAFSEITPNTIRFVESTETNIRKHLPDTDLLIGAVLVSGRRAPHLVPEDMVRTMQPGSVIVDVSIDQGGCVETSHPTTHSDPVFVKHDVIHYCVSNMPGAYPRTATIALTDATLPYAIRLANEGIHAPKNDPAFAKGVNTCKGFITNNAVAESLGQTALLREFSGL